MTTFQTSLEKDLEKADHKEGIAYSGQLRNLQGNITRKNNKIMFMEIEEPITQGILKMLKYLELRLKV